MDGYLNEKWNVKMAGLGTSRPIYGRFAALLAAGTHDVTPYDRVLLEVAGCVVAPTLGSIIPDWLLVVPRTPAINFASWRETNELGVSELIRSILAKTDRLDNRVIWFEHGPSKIGSTVGCGIDHAHLHILINPPFSFDDFASESQRIGDVHWELQRAETVYNSIEPSNSYLVAASSDGEATFARNVEQVGSQFFRRVIANLVDMPALWDYKLHPHLNNVVSTIENLVGQDA